MLALLNATKYNWKDQNRQGACCPIGLSYRFHGAETGLLDNRTLLGNHPCTGTYFSDTAFTRWLLLPTKPFGIKLCEGSVRN